MATKENKKDEEIGKGVGSFPALFLTQNNHKFYFATMPVEDIFPYCYVASRDEDPIKGFQRTLNEGRAKDIAKYLERSNGSIPTNIVLSAQDESQLSYNSKTKTIKYKKVSRAFLVLDGQHRLWGYGMSKDRKLRVPVAIYEGLTRRDEASLFIDINTNQRGVPAALLLDIKQVAEQESEIETVLRKVFNKLNEDKSSPLYGLLSSSKSAKGKISRVTFNRGVAHIIRNVIMTKLSEDTQYQLIRNYFRALDITLSNPKLLKKQTYFEAFCEFFDDVARVSRERYSNYKETSLENVLSPLSNLDLEDLPSQGRTLITKVVILDILKKTIAGHFEISEDMI